MSLWHLLSLDAPTVAAVWTIFIAGCAKVALPWKSPAAMFLAVWILYAADRLLDARGASTFKCGAHELEERHRFHQRHYKQFLMGICVVAIVLTMLLQGLEVAALRLYVLLATLLVAWFLLIHVYPAASTNTDSARAARLPKEVAVGIFFPAAVFVPTVSRAPWMRQALLPAAILLSVLCMLNCLWIYAWEHPDRRERAHWTTRFGTHHLRLLTLAYTLASVAIAALLRGRPMVPVAFVCAASGPLFLVLNAQFGRLSAVHLRASADLVLLTPLLALSLRHWIGPG